MKVFWCCLSLKQYLTKDTSTNFLSVVKPQCFHICLFLLVQLYEFPSHHLTAMRKICFRLSVIHVNPWRNNHYNLIKNFTAWMYLTSKYAEVWPRGKAMHCSTVLFTVDWVPNQQVIVGVFSEFVKILFGRSAQSSCRLNNAVNQMAVTCNWQTGLRYDSVGIKSHPNCATPTCFTLWFSCNYTLAALANLGVMIWQFIFMIVQLSELWSDGWYYMRWFDIIQVQRKKETYKLKQEMSKKLNVKTAQAQFQTATFLGTNWKCVCIKICWLFKTSTEQVLILCYRFWVNTRQ